MAANVELLDPEKISPNPENPRLIFRTHELEELEESIAEQGILVPLSVYLESKGKYVILDGERRWRCARKLGLHRVPAVIQPRPERLQNIMMMFAIHNARRDWAPLPTAMKLHVLENELSKIRRRSLTEAELAASSSLSRGAVRRYRKIMRIPARLRRMLLRELELPDAQQKITVDQVLEGLDAVDSLKKVNLLDDDRGDKLLDTFVDKFRSNVIASTVEPRKIGAIGRSFGNGEVAAQPVRAAISRFIDKPDMTIADVVNSTVAALEQTKSLRRTMSAFEKRWLAVVEQNKQLVPELRPTIEDLIRRLRALL